MCNGEKGKLSVKPSFLRHSLSAFFFFFFFLFSFRVNGIKSRPFGNNAGQLISSLFQIHTA